MATITANFTCEYELVGYGLTLEVIDVTPSEGKSKMKARYVTTYNRRKFYSKVSQLSHQAGNKVIGTSLTASTGNSIANPLSPTAEYFCTQDNIEHDDYGPTGYIQEQWVSYSKYVDWEEMPTEEKGPNSTLTCSASGYQCTSPWSIGSSLSDVEYRKITDAEGNSEDEMRKRHQLIITRECGGFQNYAPACGSIKKGDSFSIDFGIKSSDVSTYLTPGFTGFYVCVDDVIAKVPNSLLIQQTQTWVAYTLWEEMIYDDMLASPDDDEEDEME